jgi:hypothetical protein
MLIIIVSQCLRAYDSVDMGLGTDYPSPNRRIKDDAKSCAKRRVSHNDRLHVNNGEPVGA